MSAGKNTRFWLGVYHDGCATLGYVHYEFRCGSSRAPSAIKFEFIPGEDGRLVKVVRLPEQYTADFVRKRLATGKQSAGYIRYFRDGERAYSEFYEPKFKLAGKPKSRCRELAPGFGRFAERLCAMHLKTLGVGYCSTTDIAPQLIEAARTEQLRACGLPVNAPVPVDTWVRKLRRAGHPKAELPRVVPLRWRNNVFVM